MNRFLLGDETCRLTIRISPRREWSTAGGDLASATRDLHASLPDQEVDATQWNEDERDAAAGNDDTDDSELLKQIAAGDEIAFQRFFLRYQQMATVSAGGIVADLVAAEDVAQEAFLAIWSDASRFNPVLGSPRRWLLTITHHKAVDYVRRTTRDQNRRAEAAGDPDRWNRVDLAPQPAERAWQLRRDALVRAALDDLPAAQREVIALAYWDRMSQSAIAAHLHIPLGTVKTRTTAGLRRLREICRDREIIR
jgi:RNA polymerase sigma-70 factor (ECF subfamily)